MSTTRILLGSIIALTIAVVAHQPTTAAGNTPGPWHHVQASYYTEYGNHTSCGLPMNSRAWHVAALTPDNARCGREITICHHHRCVHVTVQDRGAWRHDGRAWDLTPRVKHALRCPDLCNVTWRRRHT